MFRVGRDLSWFEEWTVKDAIAPDGCPEGKREKAKELIEAIETGKYYDEQTFQELIQIFNHECLCLGLLQDEETQRSSPRTALKTSLISQAVIKLAECRVRCIDEPSYLERELQSRALLSALALLRAQNVHAFRRDYYDNLVLLLSKQFQDLEWASQPPEPAARKKFRRAQVEYLLCFAGEYIKSFERSAPITVTLLSRVAHFLFAAAPLAALPLSGAGAPALHSTLEELDNAFKPLLQRPHARSDALFNFQALTCMVISSHLVAKVKVGCTELGESQRRDANYAIQRSHKVAKSALDNIMTELALDFETSVKPPAISKKFFLAILQRGPPAMNAYFYFYGLLDCASWLGRIVPNEMVPSNLKSRMKEIAQNSTVESYRWKALEFLLADRETRKEQSARVKNSLREGNQNASIPDISNCLDMIHDCLDDEDGIEVQERCQSQSSSNTSIESALKALRTTLSPSEWIEAEFKSHVPSSSATKFSVLGKKSGRSKTRYSSGGLSPDCNHAYFLGQNFVSVYSLNTKSEVTQVPCKEAQKSKLPVLAVLSQHFLATVVGEELRITELETQGGVERRKQTMKLAVGWIPDCISIHESKRYLWVAVGGCAFFTSGFNGSIRVFKMDIADAKLGPLTLQVNKLGLNWLKSDFPKALQFSANGLRLGCVTKNNRILCWIFSIHLRPKYEPFEPELGAYRKETTAFGVTSVTVFDSPSSKPYLLATTSPSSERYHNNGEWTFISAVADEPATVPSDLKVDLLGLEKARPIVDGTVPVSGDLVALLDNSGKIYLLRLRSVGGHIAIDEKPVTLVEKLAGANKVSNTCLRFHMENGCLFLYAVDTEGTVIKKDLGRLPSAGHIPGLNDLNGV